MTSNRILFIGGTFDRTEGYPSKIVRQLAYGLYETVNGGIIKDLEEILKTVAGYEALVWMPNISNGEEKFLPKIKEKAPHIILVSSKRNVDDKYSFEDLVSRTLASRSQLLIEIRADDERAISEFRLVDPLGNISEFMADLEEFRCLLYERLQFLLKMKRIESVKSGVKWGNDIVATAGGTFSSRSSKPSGIDPQFLEAIQKYANKFHTLIHGTKENPRFMGNASFRCTKGGFPSQRTPHAIFVSKRNVDKRCLDADGFVSVTPAIVCNSVEYFGPNKPSVDTPVQIMLYQAFSKINFMLHAHVYHKEGIMTHRYVPCGDTREVNEVINVLQNPNADHFIVNLKGHGCLLASSRVEDLLNQEDNFYARPIPEKILT